MPKKKSSLEVVLYFVESHFKHRLYTGHFAYQSQVRQCANSHARLICIFVELSWKFPPDLIPGSLKTQWWYGVRMVGFTTIKTARFSAVKSSNTRYFFKYLIKPLRFAVRTITTARLKEPQFTLIFGNFWDQFWGEPVVSFTVHSERGVCRGL